jgi:hypothetical protein
VTHPWEDTPCAVEMKPLPLDELRKRLADPDLHIWAVLDACDEPLVPLKVNELGPERAVSLYRGWAERDYWAIAPYLFEVDEPLLDWIIENLWDAPWGFLCITPSELTLSQVRKHFRRFLQVKGPDGNDMMFRFFDPRVLRALLSGGSTQTAGEFFGLATEYWVEGEEAAFLKIQISRETIPGDGLFPVKGREASVTQNQMNSIVEQKTVDFQKRLHAHLTVLLAEQKTDVTAEHLWWQIERGMVQAKTYSITRECDVARYIELICCHLGGFKHSHPKLVENALYDRRKPIAARLERIAALIDQQRQRVGVV